MKRAKLILGITVIFVSAPLRAQVSAPPNDTWQFQVTPYLWAAGMNGWTRLGARTPTAKIDPSFSDVWRNLDFGAMGSLEARKGRWGIIFDSVYVKLSATSQPLPGGVLGAAQVGLKQAIVQLAGEYRVLDSAVTPIDVLAGARYTYLSGDLSFSNGAVLPGRGGGWGSDTSWTDGIAGVRGTWIITDKWSLTGYADAGAGGTKHSWQFLTSANYNFTKSIVGRVGYRIISMDYEQTNFLYNVKTSGFFVGVGGRF
jgi:hypothetical protein